MFTIELKRSKSDVCPHCDDTGVMLPGQRKLLTEFGEFCRCPIGLGRWEATKETLADIEHDLASTPPPLPPARPGPPAPYRSYRAV
ncbi:MAG TPA: hypothetical protein VEZ90_15405 [Blastocatellia bacterium]|nr:hypothetical protein [Blastocatellia bacterium]